MRKYLCVLFGLVWLSPYLASGQLQVFRYVNDSETQLIDHPVYQYQGPEDPGQAELVSEGNYDRLPVQVPNLGISDKPVYLRFAIENLSRNSRLALQCDNPILDRITLFEVLGDELVQIAEAGEVFPFVEDRNLGPDYMFELEFPINQIRQFIVKIESGEQLNVPFQIGTPKSFVTRQMNKNIFFSIYFGIVFVMLVYNLFVYLSIKDRTYLFYVLNVFFVGLVQLVLNGYGNRFFWPSSEWMRLHDTYLAGATSGLSSVIFAQAFLKIRHHAKYLNYILNFYSGLYVLAFILAFAGFLNLSYSIINFNGAAAFLLLFAAIIAARKGYRAARFYMIAWTIFLLGVTSFVLKDFGILPYNSFTLYSLAAGSALEMILISFALADRINTLKKEKEESQLKALNILRQNEMMVKEQNVILEGKVEERTRELKRSNQELKEALQNLKETQTQLVEAEKMASLGQLTAGIAHELNNPINFVSSNVTPLKRDINDILELLDKYDEAIAKSEQNEHFQALESFKEEVDLPYIKEEIDKLLNGISIGATRTAEIVKGLRMFSRLDEQDLKKANVGDCIESSLVILRSELKHKATVVKDFRPVEQIDCFPGKLNQVFVNLLSNSIQAIAKAGLPPEEGTIQIKLDQDATHVYVSIRDNGIGMDEKTKSRIFEPFFTTKSVGEGTGLGMSIVLGIINDHKGRIEVQSSPGAGTEIIITLPRSLR